MLHYALATALVFIVSQAMAVAEVSLNDKHNKLTRQLIQHMEKTHHIPAAWLRKQYAHLHMDTRSIALLQQPAEDLPWQRYSQRVISQEKLRHARDYLRQHQAIFDHYEKKTAIPREIVASIIGIETDFGRRCGQHNALASLTTLGFYYAPRSKFFLEETKALLRHAYHARWDLSHLKSSYAGALGIPQFMPSVISQTAVGHGHKTANLTASHADSIASVFHYLQTRGQWKAHQPIITPISSQHPWLKQRSRLKAGSERLQSLSSQKKGVHLAFAPRQDLSFSQRPYCLDETEKKAGHQSSQRCQKPVAIRRVYGPQSQEKHFLIYPNFKSIMSYNISENYAHAVYLMASQLRKNHEHVSRPSPHNPTKAAARPS